MRAWLVVVLALPLCGGTGCLVQSRCQSHVDCNGNESCDRATGQCRVECTTDTDCYVNGMPVGKECINYRCDFPFGERRSAPEFCLGVVNPKSSFHGQELCLSQLKGKVVMIFFALLV